MPDGKVLLIVAALALFGVLVSTRTRAAAPASSPPSLDALIQKWAGRYEVDWLLLKSIMIRESSLKPDAVNPEDPSYGLGQVLCQSSDFDSPCKNRFDVDGWEHATPRRLLDPDFNAKIAAQILAYNVRTFGMPRGVSVYNRWDQRTRPINGPFANQKYVDDVLSIYRRLQA